MNQQNSATAPTPSQPTERVHPCGRKHLLDLFDLYADSTDDGYWRDSSKDAALSIIELLQGELREHGAAPTPSGAPADTTNQGNIAMTDPQLTEFLEACRSARGWFEGDADAALNEIEVRAKNFANAPADTTKALAELVAVKDLKEQAEALEFAGPSSTLGDKWEPEFKRLRAEYTRRQPLAWAAARAALAGAPAVQPPENAK